MERTAEGAPGRAPRRRGVAALLATLALLVGAAVVAPPAQAITWGTKLCTGFADCNAKGRSNFGYQDVYRQSFWTMYGGHNCTNYVAYRLQRNGVPQFTRVGYGNAYQWGGEAARAGLTVDKKAPRPGDIAWWDVSAIGGLGHVAYVESVDVAAGTFLVSEDNTSSDFDWRVYRISEVSGFIRVAKPSLPASPIPSVSGSATVGGTLTVSAGRWAPSGVRLGYQWMRDGKPISGATGTSYRIAPADAGTRITATVTGSLSGYTTTARASAAVAVPALALTTTPVPTIAGAAQVGGTLTARPGAWAPSGVALSYQWLRNGTAIGGATGASYRVASADLGASLAVRVTGSKAGYRSVAKTSAAVAVPRQPALTAPVPTVSGALRPGSTLTAQPGAWAPSGVALSYQWLRNGAPIPGATGRTYALVRADIAKAITVRVTGAKAGYTTTAKTSRATALVLP